MWDNSRDCACRKFAFAPKCRGTTSKRASRPLERYGRAFYYSRPLNEDCWEKPYLSKCRGSAKRTPPAMMARYANWDELDPEVERPGKRPSGETAIPTSPTVGAQANG